MSIETEKGWFSFRQRWLKPEFKVYAVLFPFLAQAILISDAKSWLFGSDILGLTSMHLAYWGSLLISISIGIGSLVMPKIIKLWDGYENLANYLAREISSNLIEEISKALMGDDGKREVFLNSEDKQSKCLRRENERLGRLRDTLETVIIVGQLSVVLASLLTALRVGLSIFSS